MSDNKDDDKDVSDLLRRFMGAHDEAEVADRLRSTLSGLPEEMQEKLRKKLNLIGTTLLAQLYLRSVLAAPANLMMKVNALSVMLAALAKSFDFTKTDFTTYGGTRITSPEEFLDNMLKSSKAVLPDIEIVDDRPIMKDLPKDAIIHPGSNTKN